MKKFLTRAILGMFLIFCINQYLTYKGISLNVGLNVISFLTSGTLGLPGVALLYGVLALEIL
ncbi:MAG: pro-sigmaK processing inhibitor BofA family protein [Tyzzerella sp.]|nr:pro-sigmaK processing inhibitor BofA family protein [Tyzzerella sp.]